MKWLNYGIETLIMAICVLVILEELSWQTALAIAILHFTPLIHFKHEKNTEPRRLPQGKRPTGSEQGDDFHLPKQQDTVK